MMFPRIETGWGPRRTEPDSCPDRPDARIASLTLPSKWLPASFSPPFRGPTPLKSASTPRLPIGDEPLQLVVGQVKILARRAIGVSRATMPSANVGPIALFETTRPNPGPSAAGAVIAVGAAADGDDIAAFSQGVAIVAFWMVR